MVMKVRDYYKDQFEAVKETLPGAHLPWLAQKRQAAIAFFYKNGLPSRKQEEWKYTSVKAIEDVAFKLSTARNIEDSDQKINLAPYLFDSDQAHALVFIDGIFQPDLSAVHAYADGITVMSLAQALRERPDDLSDYLARFADAKSHGFSALNTAYIQDGIFLHCPKNTVIEPVIHLLFFASAFDTVSHIRNLIVLDENAQATVVEHYIGANENRYFTNSMTEVITHQHAKLNHFKLQQESHQGYHIGTLEVHQKQGSAVNAHSFSFGGRLVRSDTNVYLADEHVQCQLNGLYVTKGQQHVDHHTRIDHVKPHGESHEYYKGIIDGQSHAIFNGKVYVAQDAQKTNATQQNKNLLLSKQAEIDTKPQLEIFADDVKCSHGATVGQLNDDALFYLRARGIDDETARNLLIHAFANDIIERVDVALIQGQLKRILAQYL